MPASLVANALSCITGQLPDPSFEFPSVDVPGLPAILLPAFTAQLSGVTWVLDPNITGALEGKVPELPTIDIFVDMFLAGAVGLPELPAANVELPGVTVPWPGYSGLVLPDPEVPVPIIEGVELPGFDPLALIDLICTFIAIPFLLIEGIIKSLIDSLDVVELTFSLEIPDLPKVTELFAEMFAAINMPEVSAIMIGGCAAEQITDTFEPLQAFA